MKLFVLVPVDVTNTASGKITVGEAPQVNASVVEAVVNALSNAQDNGFSHPMEESISILVDLENVRIQSDYF